jgi:hypothetical protein
MTATDPADRPAASEVAAALRRPPTRRRPLEGPLARRLVSVGAFASLAASVVAGMVLLSGADTSTGAPGEPAVQAAAPEPVVAPPATTSLIPAVVEEPVAVVPTPQRPAPVPVALARRDGPATVTKTVVVRVTTVPAKADGRTPAKDRKADPAGDDDKNKNDGAKGKGKDKDDGKDDKPADDKDDDQNQSKDDSDDSDDGGNSGSGKGNSGSGNSGSGSDNSGPGNGDD